MILILGDDTTAMPILKDNKKKENNKGQAPTDFSTTPCEQAVVI